MPVAPLMRWSRPYTSLAFFNSWATKKVPAAWSACQDTAATIEAIMKSRPATHFAVPSLNANQKSPMFKRNETNKAPTRIAAPTPLPAPRPDKAVVITTPHRRPQ